MAAHIGSTTDGSNLIIVWCDRHGDVLTTDVPIEAEAIHRLHDTEDEWLAPVLGGLGTARSIETGDSQ